jgi:hypothetical protein
MISSISGSSSAINILLPLDSMAEKIYANLIEIKRWELKETPSLQFFNIEIIRPVKWQYFCT